METDGQERMLDTKRPGHMPSTYPLQEHGTGPETEPLVEQSVHQHLHRLFGHATAEYFLSPSFTHTATPPWLRQMMDHMDIDDRVSAVAIWDAMREHSNAELMRLEAESPQQPALQNKNSTDGRDLERGRGHQPALFQVRLMFRLAQINQSRAALLLANNRLPPLSETWEQEGPRKYFHQRRTTETQGGRHKDDRGKHSRI
ncbi:uncharacterized protein si:rp71-17i16.6 [Megalops cyprinoides]|uniref:uncharacterized protein si:rp71-17i16.6 n=1 Tax=Megalops cyprinoides TaxID=118141 RepID=UPI001864DD51|nr:uncharacterized protein si:rp71-17i16.6 [Megalops cyprinoides]